jgi:glycosyltransferase involved in cell wall biosynthesis
VGVGRSAVEDLVAGPRISLDVVVCTYNNASMLDRVLEALLRQEVSRSVDWRILVVNNNCTDDTDEVVARRRRESPVPLEMVREREQGLTPARLTGVANTSGDWIAFVDDDCFLAPDWIERAAQFAALHGRCGGFGGRVVLEWERPPREYVTRYGWAFAEQDHGPDPKQVRSLAGAGFVFRRAALEESGWPERHFLADRVGEKLVSGGDVEMALRVGARYPLWYNPALRLRHRIPARRTTLRYLLGVTRGLGTSKLLGDSMLWPGSYARWVVTSLAGSREWAGAAARFGARALLLRGGGKDALIQLSFLRGWLGGILRLATMGRAERRALLGSATPGGDGNQPSLLEERAQSR